MLVFSQIDGELIFRLEGKLQNNLPNSPIRLVDNPLKRKKELLFIFRFLSAYGRANYTKFTGTEANPGELKPAVNDANFV